MLKLSEIHPINFRNSDNLIIQEMNNSRSIHSQMGISGGNKLVWIGLVWIGFFVLMGYQPSWVI